MSLAQNNQILSRLTLYSMKVLQTNRAILIGVISSIKEPVTYQEAVKDTRWKDAMTRKFRLYKLIKHVEWFIYLQ